jgi:SAM-dependent methyltransferase
MLVDRLADAGYRRITVLDVSQAALDVARTRLGSPAASVTWLEADILTATLPAETFDVWHDRAVFHFLVDPDDRARYVQQAWRALKPGGAIVIATFADDGPTKCSGLPVVRYTAEALRAEFGADARLVQNVREEHATPSGSAQAFLYCVLTF